MSRLSITTAWNETAAYARREFGPLFLIAFGLIALPTIFFQALAPQAQPGQVPELGAWALLILPLMALTALGSLTITVLALREGEPRDAFRVALRRFPVLLGAALLLGIAVLVCVFPLVVVAAFVARTETSLTLLTAFLFLVVGLFLWVRLMLINPVAASEEGGPIAVIRRSWRLTSGHFSQLVGLVLLLALVILILAVAVTSVAGSLIVLVAGQPQPGNLSSVLILLVTGVLNAVVSIYFTIIVARLYRQLAAGGTDGSRPAA